MACEICNPRASAKAGCQLGGRITEDDLMFFHLITVVSPSSVTVSKPSFFQKEYAGELSFLTLATKVSAKAFAKEFRDNISNARVPYPCPLKRGSNKTREISADSPGAKLESPINPIR